MHEYYNDWGIKQGRVVKQPFSSFMHQYLETGEIHPKLLLMSNRKLHMGFRMAPKSISLDDFEPDGGWPQLFSNT